MVGPPKVINKNVDGKLFEPFEVMFLLYHIVYLIYRIK